MAQFQLNWKSIDITPDVINYTRNAAICEGTKVLTIELYENNRNFATWDELVLYEDGNKVGTFYIEDAINFSSRKHKQKYFCKNVIISRISLDCETRVHSGFAS